MLERQATHEAESGFGVCLMLVIRSVDGIGPHVTRFASTP